MRTIWRLILVAGMMTSPASSQLPHGGEAERMVALFEERKGDFDYLVGEWRFTAQHAEWGEGRGYWTAVRLSSGDGSHVLDEYRIVGEDDETLFVSTTIRAYNAARGLWELVSADRGTGLQDVGTARKVGDEMHVEQRFGVALGEPSLWRIRYYDIRPDAFSWVADRSLDDGATWERGYMRIEARRVGPARSLGPLAGPPAGVGR